MISRKALPEHVRLGLKATTPSGDFVVSSMLFNMHERGVRVCIYICIYICDNTMDSDFHFSLPPHVFL